MDRRHGFLAVALGAVLWAAGCGGQNGTPTTEQQPGAPQTASVQFTIVVPAPPSALTRKPEYVSSSTKSATISVAPGGAAVTVNCTTVCSASLAAAIGTDTFTVKLFDGLNGTGNLLSTGTLVQLIVAGQPNAVNLTFNGVAKSLGLALAPTSVTIGTPATVSVIVSVFDADGNLIVGPGASVDSSGNPLTITLSDSDTSGATHLSTTSVTAPPPPTAGPTLSYNGTNPGANPGIFASAPGLSTVAAILIVNPAPTPSPSPSPTPTPTATPVSLYVANSGNATVVRYGPPFSNASAPNGLLTIGGGVTLIGVAADPFGAQGVTANNGNVYYEVAPFGSGTGVIMTTGVSSAFDAFDANDNLWVATQGASVKKFTPPFSGGQTASLTITTSITDSDAVVFDSSANLYVTNGDTSANVLMFAPPYTGSPNFGFPNNINGGPIALRGEAISGAFLYVVDRGTGNVFRFPIPFIPSANAGTLILTTPAVGTSGIAFDPATGNMFITNSTQSVIYVYKPPFALGNTPLFTITTGLSAPNGISFGP